MGMNIVKKDKKIDIDNPLEKAIQKDIMAYLETIEQIESFRMALGGVLHSVKGKVQKKKNSLKGMADILVLYEGRAIWIEVKRPLKSTQSEFQKIFARKVQSAGCIYIIVTSVEETYRALNKILLYINENIEDTIDFMDHKYAQHKI